MTNLLVDAVANLYFFLNLTGSSTFYFQAECEHDFLQEIVQSQPESQASIYSGELI